MAYNPYWNYGVPPGNQNTQQPPFNQFYNLQYTNYRKTQKPIQNKPKISISIDIFQRFCICHHQAQSQRRCSTQIIHITTRYKLMFSLYWTQKSFELNFKNDLYILPTVPEDSTLCAQFVSNLNISNTTAIPQETNNQPEVQVQTNPNSRKSSDNSSSKSEEFITTKTNKYPISLLKTIIQVSEDQFSDDNLRNQPYILRQLLQIKNKRS